MDEVCKELIEVKAEMEKLKSDYQVKVEMSVGLQMAHREQQLKIEEAKMEIEKQAKELAVKREEIILVKQLHENLELSLKEKETIIKQLSSTNDQIRIRFNKKFQEVEKEAKELASALEEANAKDENKDRTMSAYIKEIEGLKEILTISQRKCAEAEEKAKTSKELKQRDDILLKLEQESREVEDRLKWKDEQFQLLEDAHRKVQCHFRESREEWESEKSALFNDICSLQTNLDTQVRISDGLRSQLQMCNQALAHEESRRKLLEIQLSESKTSYENAVAEFQGAQLMVQSLTARRDEEISTLRNMMATKETHFKEIEYQRLHLEQENKELCESLKELQESQIREAGAASSQAKLSRRLRSLEQAHKDCSFILKAREAEWRSRTEIIEKDLIECQFKLTKKELQIGELHAKLEECHSSMTRLKSHNEEISKAVVILKSEISQAHLEIKNSKVEMDLYKENMEDRFTKLEEQLEEKSYALNIAQEELQKERELKLSLLQRIESSDYEGQQHFKMKKELERCEEMLEESSRCQQRLKEQVFSTENALEQVNFNLAGEIQRRSKIEIELATCKSVIEEMEGGNKEAKAQLQSSHYENQQLQEKLEVAVLSKMESDEAFKIEREIINRKGFEKDAIIDDLCRQNALMKQELKIKDEEAAFLSKDAEKNLSLEKEKFSAELKCHFLLLEEKFKKQEANAVNHAKTEAQKMLSGERENFLCIANEKDVELNKLRNVILQLENSLIREREASVAATVEAKKAFQEEKDKFHLIEAQKEELIKSQGHMILSLQQEVVHKECLKQFEINGIHEAWRKLLVEWMLSKLDIAIQEEEIAILQQKLEHEGKLLSEFREKLEEETLKRKNENDMFQEVEAERKSLLIINSSLVLERDGLMNQMICSCDWLGGFSDEQMELKKKLERIIQKAEETSDECGVDLHVSPFKQNDCSPMKKVGLDFDDRSPLKALNI